MKILNTISVLLIVVTLPLVLLISSTLIVLTPSFYRFERNSESYGAENIIEYVNGKADLNASLTGEETAHLHDVRHLVESLKMVFVIAFIIAVAALTFLISMSSKSKNLAISAVLWGGAVTLGISVFLLMSLFFFSRTFDLFHKLFFAQGSYIFPENSTLIQLFPVHYFCHAFAAILVIGCLFSVLVVLAAIIYRRKT